MEEAFEIDSRRLIDAVRIWTGWGQRSWPSRDDSRLRSQIGNDDAERLLPIIKKLEVDFYSTKADVETTSLAEMGRIAKAHFRHLHPSLPGEIADAFEWCYTFDFK